MALTLWTEHGPGYRSPRFFARIARSLGRSDLSACYVVPDAGAKRRAEALCFSQDPATSLSHRILTASAWLAGLATIRQPVIEAPDGLAVIHTLLQTTPLDYFHPSAAAATRTLIAQGITSALYAGLSPAQLHHLSKDYGQEREQDLTRIFETYISRLAKDHRVDAAQIPGMALEALQQHTPHHRIIVETGMAPIPILWKILRALEAYPTSPDLHVIVPDFLRGRAESELGVIAQEIGPDEWVATTPPRPQLYRAPHLTAEYRWMAQQISSPRAHVLALDPDPTLWLSACMAEGILHETALPLTLAASPVSAPWFDSAIWQQVPASATLAEWIAWWQDHLYPDAQQRRLQEKNAADDFTGRMFRDIARWESVWLRVAATTPAAQPLAPPELRTLIDPFLQDIPTVESNTLPYTPVSLFSHLGDPVPGLFVLDATQSNLPSNAVASPFFKSTAMLPLDLNAHILRDAFPSTESCLQLQIAAWQRIEGCASTITACYASASDERGEQFPSLLLDAEPQDIPVPQIANPVPHTSPPFRTAPETLLKRFDTLAHVRHCMKDHVFSITELEDFAECPFRHFARYILGIDIPDEEGPEISARNEGSLIHRLLERYYRNLHTDIPALSGDKRKTAVRKIFEDILTREVRSTTPLQQFQIERLLQSATHAVLLDLATRDRLGNAALQPTHLEWVFGGDGTPPLTLDSPDTGPVRIRGKIDRIDSNPVTRELLLLDYKYGGAGPVVGNIRKGIHLQIPIYLLAARSVFGDFIILGGLLFDLKACNRLHGMARRSAGEFLGISDRYQSSTKDEAWDELLRTASAYAVHYARQIRQGEFPVTAHSCEHCDWKGLLPWED